MSETETQLAGRRFYHTLLVQAEALGLLLAVLWGVEGLDYLLGGRLDAFGIQPRTFSGLFGIPLAPFLHDGFGHVAANTLPLLVLGWVVLWRGVRQFVEVTLVVVLLGGLGVWVFGRGGNTSHIGASGLVFGYFGFLLLRAWFERSVLSVIVALGVLLLYGGYLWGILPAAGKVSWESHLSGFAAGVVSARAFARPPRGTGAEPGERDAEAEFS